MTNRAKRYSTRAASIAIGTVALGLLIWSLIAFAGGSVTVTPSGTVPLGTKVTGKLAGGFANASSYRVEFWGPTANNAADDAAHRMRCYSTTVRPNALGGATTVYTTNVSTNYQGSNWTARYLYNPNYNSPAFVVFDAPLTSVATGTNFTFKFHLVDRYGKMILTDHTSDIEMRTYRGTSAISVTWTFSGGYYTSSSYSRSSSTTANLQVAGRRTSRWFSSYTSTGTSAKESKDFYWSNIKRAMLVVRIGSPTSAAAYRITPAGGHATFATNTTINTSGEYRSSMIYVPGTPNPYTYTYRFDVFDNGATTGGTPAAVTSGLTINSATAQGAGGNATPFNYNSGTLSYTGGHWQVQFSLPGPDKYGIRIRATKTNTVQLFQVVNLAGTSPVFTVGAPKTPPANPSSFTATPGDRKVGFGWTNPPNPSGGTLKGIIICRKLDNNPFDAPADGTSYNVGGVVQATPGSSGSSTVVYKLDPASASATGQVYTDGDSCNINNMLTNGGNYYYKAFAYDTLYSYSSGVSSASNNPAVPYDTTAPGVVTARSTGATGESNGVAPLDKANQLNWTPPTDCDYHGAIIYARTDGSWPSSPTGADGARLVNNNDLGSYTENTWTDTSLNNGTQVYYSLWSKDDDGNVNSTPVHLGPMAPRDTQSPGQVQNLQVIAHDAFTATLQWTAPADNGYTPTSGNATAYDIRYVGTDDPTGHPYPISDSSWSKSFLPGGATLPAPQSNGTVQTYKVEGLSPNHTYYFAIRARDEVFNWSTASVNAQVTTDCNAELTQCNQCHQMPPTDGLPGEHPRSVGNIGAHYLPIHTGGGDPKQCNVCHANGRVFNEVSGTLIYKYNHQNEVININYSGLIGNKLWRDNKTGGKFVGYTVIVHKNQHTGYSTAVGYKQLTGYCVNTYCHGQGAGASASPIWGMESVTCGQICHETPPATGKHVKHYHPGKYYINEAPFNHTPVSGYTNDTSTAFWTPSNLTRTSTVDNGDNMNQGGNADPRYATYVASSNAVRTLPGLSQNTTYYVTVCVGDSAGALTGQYVALSNSSSGPWTTILSADTSATRLFKKTVDYPFLVTSGNMYMKIGDGTHVTKLNYFIVNVSPEAPTSNNTVLANTTDEYGFACGKCHYTSSNELEKHTNHVGGPYKYSMNGNEIVRIRDAELAFDVNSNPKNLVTSNYTAIFGTVTSYMDGQRFHYTLGSQCQNLYCHGTTLNAGGSNTTPRWTGGYIDEQGSSICGSCHAANYKALPSEQTNRNMTTGSHVKHVTNAYPYVFNCSKCHNTTVNPRAADGSLSIKDKTHHVNGVVDVVFDPNDPTMRLGHYSAIATPKYGYCLNVYCHSNGLLNASNQPFGATRYATPQWSVSRNVPCDFCHGSGSSDGTPLYLTSATTFNSHPTHTKVNGIKCGMCHNRTVGYDGQSIIQKNNTTFHVNGLIDVYFNYSVVKVSGGNNPSYSRGTRQCANTYCHGTAVPSWGGTIACGSCHGLPPLTANLGRHDVHSNGNYGNLTTGSTANANKSLGYDYDFDCRFCHYQRSHGTGAVSDVQAAEVNFNPIDVQNAYNNSGGTYTPGLTGTPDSKGWNYSGGTCSVKCHSDGKGGPPNVTTYKWTDAAGSLGCTGCHNGVKGDTPEMSTGRHQAHIDTAPYSFTCDTCHYATASVNSVAHAEKHVNGTVDVVIKGGGTYTGSGGTGTCSGTYCHSNGNPGFDKGSANYFATSPVWSGGQMTCTTCHSNNHYDGAGDGVRSTGQTLSYNHQKHLSNYSGYGSRIGCANCHNMTASSNTEIWDTAVTHVNGTKDVVFWTASTAGTGPRTKFVNMTGPDSAVPLTGIWGVYNVYSTSRSASCTVLCHSDGRGNPPNRMPNWSTAQATYGCGSCHGYAVSGFNNMTSGSHQGHVAGSNYACGTCHRLTAGGGFGAAFINRSGFLSHHVDGSVDVNLALSIGGTYNSGTKVCSNTSCHGAASPVWGTGTTTCVSCHNSPPRNAQHFGHYSATGVGQVVTGNNTVDGSTATVYQFGCGKCHLTPPATHNGGAVKSNQTAEISFDAGTNPMNPNPGTLAMYTTTNFVLYSSGTFRESKGLCRNLYCHSNGQTPPTYSFINWSTKGTSVTCTSCHKGADTKANMQAGGLAGAHPAHAATDTYGFTCNKCHDNTVSGNTAISYKNNHVNGVKDVYFTAQGAGFPNLTGYYYGSPTYNCRNTYCHSDGNGGHIGTQIAWNTAGPLACTACHNGNAASGSPITTGKHTAHINNADANITKYGCALCHTRTVSGDTTLLASKAYHVNGTKDVYFQAFNGMTGLYVSSTKTCRSNYCHSSGQKKPTFRVTTGWARSWTANCNSCHGADSDFTAINGSPNYPNTYPNNTSSWNGHKVAGHVSSASDCIHCHLHTVNSFGGLTTATTQHLDGTREVIFQQGGTYNSTTKTCTSTACHGATAVTWGGPAQNCSSCHSDMGAGTKNTQHYFTGKHQKHTNQTTYRFACELCHARLNTSNNTGHATGNVSTNQAAEVIFQDTAAAWNSITYKNVTTFRYIRMNYLPGTATLTNIGAYQPGAYVAGTDNPDTLNPALKWTKGRCTNVWCHSNGQSTPTYNTYQVWTSAGTYTCTSCHGDKTSNTLSGKHQQHVNQGDLGKFTCEKCHNLTVNSGGAILTNGYTNHVNGTRDVYFSNILSNVTGTYVPATGCRANYCHSSGQRPTGPLPNVTTPKFVATGTWTAGAALGCNGCHGTTNSYGYPDYANRSSYSRVWFNSHAKHVASGADCINCHRGTVNVFGNLTTGSTQHIDGTRNVSFRLGGVYTAATKTCSNTDPTNCHGAGVVEWGGWRGYALAPQCKNCHYRYVNVSNAPAGWATGAKVDDFTYGNSTKSWVTFEAYTAAGHGKKGKYPYIAASVSGANKDCTDCHSTDFPHNDGTNFFRLVSSATIHPRDPNTLCSQVACHGSTAAVHDQAHVGSGTWAFQPKCMDCHDPHGDSGGFTAGQFNAAMIHGKVSNSGSDSMGRPIGANRSSVDFPANYARAKQLAAFNWSSFVTRTKTAGSNKGICRVCHTDRANTNYFSVYTSTSHNSTNGACITCHTHSGGFAPAGGSDCKGCHGTNGSATSALNGGTAPSGQGRRNMELEFGNATSHHIVAAWSAITGKECAACHAEGNYSDGSMNSTYHPSQPGKPVMLKKWLAQITQGSNGTYGTTFTVITCIRSGDTSATASKKLISNSTLITPFCLGCHSDQNNAVQPFLASGDTRTPIAYAWDNDSIDSRYSNTAITPWGKFNSSTYNVVPADMVTKALSPHGNAKRNNSVMSIATFSMYSSTKVVACYDCHNAHASDVARGSSYTSGVGDSNGGILKCYSTPGGLLSGKYISTKYHPMKGGNASEKNEAASSSTLCFDCHIDGAASAAPKKYTDFGLPQGKTIAGSYYDRVGMLSFDNWSTTRWSTNDTWRGSFAYKDAKFVGGHFGRSTPAGSPVLQTANMGTNINDGFGGKCTKCHDPHGTSSAISTGYTKAVRTIYSGSGADPDFTGSSYTGAANASYIYVLQIVTGGTKGTATYRYSTDGGDTWTPTSGGTSTSTNLSSNGIVAAFGAGTYATDDTWTWLAGANPNYMVPALKGTWMHSPYKEDRAPRNDYSVSGGRLASVPRANDFTAYSSVFGNRRLWDDNAGGTTAPRTSGRMVGGPGPRANPDFKTGSYMPGYNIPAIQGDGFGQGPLRNYGGRTYQNVTGYNGWNGYFIDENTFGTNQLKSYWQAGAITPTAMSAANASATPGNFAGLCLQCHAWTKSSGNVALSNVTSANLATGWNRITTYPHQTVFGLSSTAVDLFRRGNTSTGSAAPASGSNIRLDPSMHGINYYTMSTPVSSSYAGPAGLVSSATSYGWRDSTGGTGSAYGRLYRWGVSPAYQRTAGTIQGKYHQFPCAKCHTPHVSRLPRLMKTNCLDNDTMDNNGSAGVAHTTMNYVTDGTTPPTISIGSRTSLWGAMFRNVACHSTKIGIMNTNNGLSYFPGGWNDKTPW